MTITLNMLPFIPLHFLCTYFWQPVYYWIITNTSTTDITWPSCSLVHYLLPFFFYCIITLVLFIFTLMTLFSMLSFHSLSLVIRSSSVSAITQVKSVNFASFIWYCFSAVWDWQGLFAKLMKLPESHTTSRYILKFQLVLTWSVLPQSHSRILGT